MKCNINPLEILNYLKNKSVKEKKARTEFNNKNNNLLKDISLSRTLKILNVDTTQQNCFSFNINNALYINEKTKNKKEDNSKKMSNVLILNKLNYNKNFLEFFKNKNNINLDNVKKYLNIKKKKFNKGIDFCSFFLLPKPDYYANILNQGIINSFISFYLNAEKWNSNNDNFIEKYNETTLNIHTLKIYSIKYPIFIIKQLKENNLNYLNKYLKNEKKGNIYEKYCNILGLDNNSHKNSEELKRSNFFMKGLNHDIKYDLENYLCDKIKLLEIDTDENLSLYENTNFINKYPFQFIKISKDKNIQIDRQNIIIEKNLKYSFNKPRMMYPLFLNSMFDNTNIFKQCSFYKNKNIKNTSKCLSLFFQKNMDRVKDIEISNFGKNFLNSENCLNIFSGLYLTNPLQTSIYNKEFKANLLIRPKKLNVEYNKIIGQRNINKYRQKRRYLDLNNKSVKKKEEDIKVIIINKKNVAMLLNNCKEYLMTDNINEGFDFLFDFSICGKILYVSDFLDEFEYNGYNNLIDLINKNYIYYSKFYIFIIDDEKLNQKEGYSVNNIVKKINQLINNKFSYIINNNNYQFNIITKVITNPHLINYEINNIYNDLVANNFNNLYSVYNSKIFNKIISDIKNNEKIRNGNNIINYNNKNDNFNLYENYILNIISDTNLKKEIEGIINSKYSKRNII